MVYFFYNLAMLFVTPLMRVMSLFSKKAALWVKGRRGIFEKMEEVISDSERIVWFHAASLGEFEQGRPVIEKFREHYPDKKILLTFFSPSGYEIRKNYAGADYIFYLPSDTVRNVRRFMHIVRPEAAFFIKYEFWVNYLTALKTLGVRTFLISGIFREDQIFFKPYGGLMRKALDSFEYLFVQNRQSVELLHSIGLLNCRAVGDTRFDRVHAIVSQARTLPLVEEFIGHDTAGKLCSAFIAGSTWGPDEELLKQLINDNPKKKFIIAPHEIVNSRIEALRSEIKGASVRYTSLSENLTKEQRRQLAEAQVLFIDTIGILSSVYRYGNAAYIGGGFGVGIHNTLEAATFSLPLAFGPNYKRFQEACQLIERGGAASVCSYSGLRKWFNEIVCQSDNYKRASRACGDYVSENIGATDAIIEQYSLHC